MREPVVHGLFYGRAKLSCKPAQFRVTRCECRISPAAAGFPAMAASIIQSAHSQEISLPATGLRFLEYARTGRLAVKAATAIRVARSGRASVAIHERAHIAGVSTNDQ